MEFLLTTWETTKGTLRDVLPIAVILFSFQFLVLRRPLPEPRKLLIGFAFVILGLTLFLLGLEQALFPIGRLMAEQLTHHEFTGVLPTGDVIGWDGYFWIYVFALALGFSTTIAEPALMAIAIKAEELSGGAIRANGLRIAVAVGVAIGLATGSGGSSSAPRSSISSLPGMSWSSFKPCLHRASLSRSLTIRGASPRPR